MKIITKDNNKASIELEIDMDTLLFFMHESIISGMEIDLLFKRSFLDFMHTYGKKEKVE